MMDKKRSIGITVFGLFSILVGLTGFLPNAIDAFDKIWHLVPYGFDVFNIASLEVLLTAMNIFGACCFLCLIVSGILILKLNPVGRKLSLYLSPFTGLAIFGCLHEKIIVLSKTITISAEGHFLIPSIIAACFLLFQIWFLNVPKVEEQFK